jgi:hypothetical protein
VEKFGNEVQGRKVYKTPGTPRFKITRTDDESDQIDVERQKRYCSGVGMLLYLTKYSRTDLCNVVRELSKCMDRATMGSYLEMLRAVKFVIDTKTFCLKIRPKIDSKNWNLKVFCDNDWAEDPETRISVTGFMFTFKTYLLAALKGADRRYYFKQQSQICGNVRSCKRKHVCIFSSSRYWDCGGSADRGQNRQYWCAIYVAKFIDRRPNPTC